LSSFTPASASLGTTITIKGNNLTNATAVNFGGTPATAFTVTSDTTITAQVGTGSTGFVKVITPDGVDSLGTFTYVTLAPHVISFTPTSGTATTIVSIKGSNFTGTTAVSFGGT
ncbi:IPT/TIG domain-containing protein, partial [Niastella yeongjuensis]|uniref:IPT/TIG domain-containing protein n=1 Tax=Niastella yeongjuensis TaxID=354355 RepID=UPI001A98DDE6